MAGRILGAEPPGVFSRLGRVNPSFFISFPADRSGNTIFGTRKPYAVTNVKAVTNQRVNGHKVY